MNNNRVFLLLLFCVFAASGPVVSGQSGRVPVKTTSNDQTTVRELFEEANTYRKKKYEEFEKKKLPVSDNLRQQAEKEQKQLAARYAAASAVRSNLTSEDIYYLALLYWIAENYVETESSLRKFLAYDDTTAERQQSAKALLAVVLAKQQKPEEAAAVYNGYLKNEPVKSSEKLRINIEIARSFRAAGRLPDALQFALEAFSIARATYEKQASSPAALDMIFDAGLLAFDISSALADEKNLEEISSQLRSVAAAVGNTRLYFLAIDKLLIHKILSGKKSEALAITHSILNSGLPDLTLQGQREDVLRRLRTRERHYKMLLEPAPEIIGIDRWIPGTEIRLSDLKGKVVLLDFWATWCAPCLAAFPHLSEWHREYSGKGLVIIGITRYYGNIYDKPVSKNEELEYLRRFKEQYKLPYDFAVARDQGPHLTFGATALPTAVLIDKKGIVRFVEVGTSESRIEELQEMIVRLLAE
ncbi:MAG: redoxin domain-containing protein [Pyrinomonadaceae bacterium]